MAFDPSTAQPVSQSSFNPSTAQPAAQSSGFDPSTAKPVNELDNIYQQEAGQLHNEDTTSVDTVPIVARAATGLARTSQGKADMLNKISPELNASVTKDGKVLVNGKPFDLNPDNMGSFFYDLPGMIGEATSKNLPLAASIGATALTGGASIPIQMAAQAAAMGGTEAMKELAAQGMVQEKMSPQDIAVNAAVGGAGPVADMAFIATAKGLKSVASNLTKFTGPARDVGPEVLNATAGIKLGVGDKVFQKMDNGEDLSKIITPDNASPTKPSEILSNTFYGNPSAARTPENFVNTLKDNISKADPANVDSLKKMYQDVWGISPQTIETVINNPTKDVINSGMFADNAALTIGSKFAQSLKEADTKIEQEYGKTLTATINNLKVQGKNAKNVNIGSALDEMFKAGATPDVNPTGIGIFEGNAINPGYLGSSAKKVYGALLSKLEDNKLGLSNESSQILKDILARNPNANIPSDVTARMTKGGHFKELSAPAAYKFLSEIKPLLDRTFESGVLSDAEKRPLAGFMKNIRTQLGEISPKMKDMNAKYGTYQSAREFFGNGKPGNISEMLNINSKMAQAYSDPGIRTAIGTLDNTLKSKELTNMIDHLGASQELKSFFDKATGKAETKLQGLIGEIRGLSDKTATHGLQNMAMEGYDSLLPQNKRFLDPMWNHLIASEFQNKPLSVFKSKYVGLMALQMAGMGHVGVLPALAAGVTLSNPRNLSRGLMALQRMKGVGSKVPSGAPAKAGQMANRIILNNMLQSAKKSKEGQGR